MHILLMTDFSNTWSGVAEMKGVLKSADPALDITDLTHDIRRFDVHQAALTLKRTLPHWPKDTLALCVVDPGVGTERPLCVALLASGQYVVTPDNGTLSYMDVKAVRKIEKTSGGSKVFAGRDVLAKVAGDIASGKTAFEAVGPAYDVKDICVCPEALDKPVLGKGYVHGTIPTGYPHYGSLETNISAEDFAGCDFETGDKLHVLVTYKGAEKYRGVLLYVTTFGDVDCGEALIYEGSAGMMAIDVNRGLFLQENNLSFGNGWEIYVSLRPLR